MKRFATTTEAEIEEKRLKLNAERTIKQNKAAVLFWRITYFKRKLIAKENVTYTCAVWYNMEDIWTGL